MSDAIDEAAMNIRESIPEDHIIVDAVIIYRAMPTKGAFDEELNGWGSSNGTTTTVIAGLLNSTIYQFNRKAYDDR